MICYVTLNNFEIFHYGTTLLSTCISDERNGRKFALRWFGQQLQHTWTQQTAPLMESPLQQSFSCSLRAVFVFRSRLICVHRCNDRNRVKQLGSVCVDGLVCMCSGCTCRPVGLSSFHQSLSMPKTKALAKPWSGADRTCNRVRVKDGSWE